MKISHKQIARSYQTAMAAIEALRALVDNRSEISTTQQITFQYCGHPFTTDVRMALGMAEQELRWLDPCVQMVDDGVEGGVEITMDMARNVLGANLGKKD